MSKIYKLEFSRIKDVQRLHARVLFCSVKLARAVTYTTMHMLYVRLYRYSRCQPKTERFLVYSLFLENYEVDFFNFLHSVKFHSDPPPKTKKNINNNFDYKLFNILLIFP